MQIVSYQGIKCPDKIGNLMRVNTYSIDTVICNAEALTLDHPVLAS